MGGLVGFILAGLALTGSPGPATLSLAATGAAFGIRRGLGYLAGIVLGMVGVMAIAASGAAAVVLALPGARPAITVLAAGYFTYLALRIATAPALATRSDTRRPPSLAGGIGLSLINPKGYAAMAALFSGFVLVRPHLGLDALAKGGVLTAMMMAVDLAWLLAGAGLTRWFEEPRASRRLNLAFAALLVGSVVATLFV